MLAMASPPGRADDQEGRRHLSPGDAGAGADAGESSFDFGFLRDGTPPVQQQQQQGASSHKAAVSSVKSGSGGGRGAMTKASGDKRAFPFSLRKKKKDIPVMDDMMLDDENSFASPALMGIAAAQASSELKTALTAKRDALMLAPVTPLRRSPFADKTNLDVIRNSLEKSGDGNTEIDSSSKTLLKQNNMRLVERLSCADDELRSLKEALRSKECGVTAMLKVLGEQSTSHIALEAENGELQNQINMMAAEVMELQRQLTSLQVRRVHPSSNGHTPRSSRRHLQTFYLQVALVNLTPARITSHTYSLIRSFALSLARSRIMRRSWSSCTSLTVRAPCSNRKQIITRYVCVHG